MLKSYFKIAWRNLKKNSLYAFVNITGLTVGILSCLLIGIYIKHELSYDRFNGNADSIVRLTMDYSNGGYANKTALTGTKVGPQFKRTFPEVADFARMEKRSDIVKFNNKLFKENGLLYADPAFFTVFSFPLYKGNPSTVLNTADKIVVTQSAAKKYFGSEAPVGKILMVGEKNYIVSGVAIDAPSNSQIKFDFIISFNALSASKKEVWWSANYVTYLLLKNKEQVQPLQKEITAYMQTISKGELKMNGSQYLTYHLEPLESVHLQSSLPGGLEPNGNMTSIYILSVVAMLILTIACVNYINLSIAQSAGRGAEIGIRKVLGAGKRQLFNQFIGESLFITAFAAIASFFLAYLLLPLFNHLSGQAFEVGALFDPVILIFLMLLGLIIGFASGAYPALILSGIKLVSVLKSGFSFTSGHSVRRSLIVFQFIISIFLIIATIIILQQLSFIRSKNLGYNKSDVVVLPIYYTVQPRVNSLKKEIGNVSGVEAVAAANSEPIDVNWGDVITTTDRKSLTVNALPMDEDFIKTMELKLIAGEEFNHTDVLKLDTTNQGKNFQYSFMLNETAAKALGWSPEEAVGKEIMKGTTGRVKAVLKDFNFKSFHDPIGPLLIFLDHDQTQNLFIRINGNNASASIRKIEALWKKTVPERPFEYRFLDDEYDALYKTEQRTAGVFTTFSSLAITLACLGLFAVTAYSVVQRTKEIGIRKVLGAKVSSIILLISQDFLILVLVATAIASPIAWYIANKWLQDFAYRVQIHWWIFLAAGLVSLIVAGLTVSAQAFKAALANPVESLKSE